MKVEKNKVVQIHYTLKNNDDQIIDSTDGGTPLAYIQGIGNLIPGLETELENKAEGEKLKVTIEPKDAYGEYTKDLVMQAAKSGFKSEGDETLEVGMQVQVETNNGPSVALVTKIEEEDVTLDLNHPLAGETLFFDVEVVGIREATAEELDHGHAHGEGGHHH